MKNNFPKIFLIAVIGILIFPQISFAAWWNPFSWFKKPTDPPKVLQVSTTTPTTNKPVATTTPKTVKETTAAKLKATPQAKITDQSSEIKKLRAEVEELKKPQRKTSIPEPVTSASSQKDIPQNVQVQIPTPTPSQSINSAPPAETWEELEVKYFVEANQKGWANLTITNQLGDKRYYRKEGTQWMRKNSEVEAQVSYYTDTGTIQLQRTVEFLENENARDIAHQKEIDEKTKPFYDELGQKREEWMKKCINPDGAMPFLSGQLATECDKLSLDQRLIQNKINSITGIYPSTQTQTPATLRTPQGWIIDKTTKTIFTPDGTSKYYYFCTSAECRINAY